MKATTYLIAASLLAASAANAATIQWGSEIAPTSGNFGELLNEGLFDTSGTLVSAENLGGSETTFDGITFAAGNTTFTTGGTFDGFHQNGQLLSEHGIYGGGGAADTVSLDGLIIGKTYRIQALVYDGRGAGDIPGRTVEFDGINQGQYSYGISGVTWGNGLLVTGVFTADSTTQDFTIEAFAGSNSKGGQLNALTVFETAQAIPEPSSAALLGIGGLALIMRRRK
ncbi:PEP-CTERM sorting domain-containing protein [Sulfuriroseicoccus oceanibius]|uniref:PEP-CTERM sorting domain-containing protein n=1 Tax=Sulfuriroseicoccus oceanibius TaxID=2707525 RepID=A0A6B3L1T3_9BACT|nr:PEP-CTERM sorting domain-containing protein [Sulfuriroseicoccus oceanibius]QQL45504.1 PEP-CTERM sorting domain-containing protein [Sulfuriroseicoccus oceanibius]